MTLLNSQFHNLGILKTFARGRNQGLYFKEDTSFSQGLLKSRSKRYDADEKGEGKNDAGGRA